MRLTWNADRLILASSRDRKDIMEIIRKEKDFRREFKNPVLTIGNFDGVHLGHQRIFQRVKEKAKRDRRGIHRLHF